MTWEEARDRAGPRAVAVLPVGAMEAHGPHLPLSTDVVIAEAMAVAGAERLAREGRDVLLLPALPYTAAGFAADFPGTLSVGAEAVAALLLDVTRSLARHGVGVTALANAHLDPAHLEALREAVSRAAAEGLTLVAPDLTRRALAARLTEEFRSGACHAGRFEGSVVLARRPALVRREAMQALPEVPVSLSDAVRDGRSGFVDAGLERAYCGAPAEATPSEGEATIETLGLILAEAVLEAAPA
ncbi:MAG: creatininase family protein [Gemmatimonadetes bacterium]|nr:creatininase family protein [Gemmatimonadota bacterium]